MQKRPTNYSTDVELVAKTLDKYCIAYYLSFNLRPCLIAVAFLDRLAHLIGVGESFVNGSKDKAKVVEVGGWFIPIHLRHSLTLLHDATTQFHLNFINHLILGEWSRIVTLKEMPLRIL